MKTGLSFVCVIALVLRLDNTRASAKGKCVFYLAFIVKADHLCR